MHLYKENVIKYFFYICIVITLPFLFTHNQALDAEHRNAHNQALRGERTKRGYGEQSVSLSEGERTGRETEYTGMVIEVDKDADIGLTLLKNPLVREHVFDYFLALTGNEDIAQAILTYTGQTDVPLFLAFSLAWVESRFDPKAESKNRITVDRGLFQLNSRSFPHLTRHECFDPYINAKHGIHYLDACIEDGGNVIAGLAMYNAGKNRVENGGTPRRTLDYISHILEYRDRIQDNFLMYMEHTGIVVKIIQDDVHVALFRRRP